MEKIKKAGVQVKSNLLEWKSTAVGIGLAAIHLYQHFGLGENLSYEALVGAGYIIIGLSHKKQ